jgi:hypothetical protein
MWTIFVLIHCTHTPVPLPKFTVYCICTVWLLLFCLIYTQKKTQWSICENVYYSSSSWLYLKIFTSIVHTGQGSCFPLGSCQKCSEYCTWSPSKKSVVEICVSHLPWVITSGLCSVQQFTLLQSTSAEHVFKSLSGSKMVCLTFTCTFTSFHLMYPCQLIKLH